MEKIKWIVTGPKYQGQILSAQTKQEALEKLQKQEGSLSCRWGWKRWRHFGDKVEKEYK